jgi:hypothetical protein
MQQARRDGRYGQALRRLLKRREAISTAAPFLAAIVAETEAWLFENGVLCHLHGDKLRILDIHGSASHELVVDIRRLLDEALPESRSFPKYEFHPLYYSDGIVSCRYSHRDPRLRSWLVVFRPAQNQILTVEPLNSAHKLFVRNNEHYLYYGTHSAIGPDGFRRWVIHGFDILGDGTGGEWLEKRLYLTELAGSDMGSTICFDIIDGYFYGLSNQTDFELERIDWASYYCCFRFPVQRSGFDSIEWLPKGHLWRRQHLEGPIDDRWTFLRIFRDEHSGELKILESRKEWLSGRGSATRSYYTKKILFGQSSSEGDDHDADDQDQHRDMERVRKRRADEVHIGDDASTSIMFTLSKCFIRSYHVSSQTYLDLVDNPSPSEPDRQRIRIRAGTRNRGWKGAMINECLDVSGRGFCMQTQDQTQVRFWPDDQDTSCPNPALDDLYDILTPSDHGAKVRGVSDDRCLVYAKGQGPLKTIVLISFDPAIYIHGTRPYGSQRRAASPSNPRTSAFYSGGRRSPCKAASPTAKLGAIASWTTLEEAQYMRIGRGYHFAK